MYAVSGALNVQLCTLKIHTEIAKDVQFATFIFLRMYSYFDIVKCNLFLAHMTKKHFAGHWSNTPGPAPMLVIQSENGETASLHVVSLTHPIY